MRIAVASHDGGGVAETWAHASRVLVFPVDGDLVGEPQCRPLSAAADAGTARNQRAQVTIGDVQLVPLALPLEAEPLGDEGDFPASFLRAIADCEVLVAGRISSRQRQQCLRLGILALNVDVTADVAQAVRFVVAGTPPSSKSGCSACPSARRVIPAANTPLH